MRERLADFLMSVACACIDAADLLHPIDLPDEFEDRVTAMLTADEECRRRAKGRWPWLRGPSGR